MATKKEKDLNKITDLASAEYIRAITSSGESVQIKKSDLLKVVNESANGLFPANLHPTLQYLFKSFTKDKFENEPLTEDTLDKRCMLFRNRVVFSKVTPSEANWIFGLALRASGGNTERQFIFDYNGKIYTRHWDGEKWSDMVLIAE